MCGLCGKKSSSVTPLHIDVCKLGIFHNKFLSSSTNKLPMRKIYFTIIAASLFFVNGAKSQNLFNENFDDMPAMFASGGWDQQNNSVPLGPDTFHSGINMAP